MTGNVSVTQFLLAFLTVTLFVLVLCAGENSHEMNNQSLSRDEEIRELLAILKDPTLRENDSDRVLKAIRRLGELKATVAVNDLIQFLTFNPVAEKDRLAGMVTERSERNPAAGSLVLIGKPALPALIEVIETKSENDTASRNAMMAVQGIFRDTPSEGSKYLKESAAKASSLRGKQRLLRVAEMLSKIRR